VVSRIRSLFTQAAEPRHPAAIGDVIGDVRRLLADRTSQSHVAVSMNIAPDLPAIRFDVVQIQQVLVNLMSNAIDAMDGQASPRLWVSAFPDGEMLRIEVSDNGPGVANVEKVFDAFFTTKPSGMGMGLAICRSIVESHGGRLWVETNPEGGSTFAFTLPIQSPLSP
jgi:C4-dicarboxylate-specific signal transduction histidine kinase